jgi:hypothetical protein
MGIFSRLTPGLVDTASSFLIKSQFKSEPKQFRQNSLWQAGQDGQVRGDQSFIRRSGYTAVIANPLASFLVVATIGAAVGYVVLKKLKD